MFMITHIFNTFTKRSTALTRFLNVRNRLATCLSLSAVLWISSAAAEIVDLPPPPGEIIEVGDHRLHLDCRGKGHPTVILESGLGGNSLDWVRVQPGVAEFTQVCAYDRAGYGWSELGSLPRTSLRIAAELHRLLEAAAVKAPYILVGHSFGGYGVRLFSARFPKQTAGIVLVDASHEQQFRYLPKAGLQPHAAGRHIAVAGLSIPDNLPSEFQEVATLLASSAKAFITLQSEMRYFQHSADQTLRLASKANLPITVLSRGKRVWPQNELGDRLEVAWQWLQEDLFSRVGTSHRVAVHSGHYIHLDQPDMVIDAIRDLVGSVRKLNGG